MVVRVVHWAIHQNFLRNAKHVAQADAPPPVNVLAPVILAVLNSAFASGRVPAQLNASLVTPVYKRGNASDPDNYRPISVTDPLMRLYASILNARIVNFTEEQDLRSPSQAGFRPGLSTLHQLLTLQHFVDRNLKDGRPLYCCFLDLKGAFDRVQRPLLWELLGRLGIHGRMLAAVQSLYTDCTVAIHVAGRTGSSIPSITGVKQGCPLSPTLFGLLLDGLHRFLRSHCPVQGPLVGPIRVPDLAYADDVVLADDSTPDGLQVLIDATHAFCCSVGLEISAEKTFTLAFGVDVPTPLQWSCAGKCLPRVNSVKYLGLMFDSTHGLLSTF